jgi:hypothetical protein
LGVVLRRLRRPHRFTSEPIRDLLPGERHRQWALKHSRIGRKPQKREQGTPGQSDPGRTVELIVEQSRAWACRLAPSLLA